MPRCPSYDVGPLRVPRAFIFRQVVSLHVTERAKALLHIFRNRFVQNVP
jgi:hypothetical protein